MSDGTVARPSVALVAADAERALLGCVLIDPDAFARVAHTTLAEHFYVARHQWLWTTFVSLRAADQPIDFVTVANELERRQKLAEFGGAAYLARLVSEVPTSLNAEAYACTVEEMYLRRALLEAATRVAKFAYAVEGEVNDAIEGARRAVGDVATLKSNDTLRPVASLVEAVVDDVVDEGLAAARVVPTGMPELDKVLRLERQTLTVLMGRPGMGKTALLLQVADLASEAGRVVAFFSKEMSAHQLIIRMACRRAGVCVNDFKNGVVLPDRRHAVVEEVMRLYERPTLYLDESVPQTTEAVRASCQRLFDREGKLDLVVGDHLRLFADRADNEVHRLGRISWGWKMLAKEFDVPTVLGAQLSRLVEGESDKRPDLHHLRDSGEIEENADNVAALYRERYYDPSCTTDVAEVITRKARDGRRNDAARFFFKAETMSFEALAERHVDLRNI